jgi:S1-C subfamily serine protease
MVRKIAEDLIDYGRVQRAILGVSMVEVNDALARELGMAQPSGVLLAQIQPGGAADVGGVEADDVLLRIDGVVVKTPSEVQERITRYSPGDVVELNLLRKGKEVSLRVRLMGEEGVAAASEVVELMGAGLRAIGPDKARQMLIDGGVEIVSLARGKMKSAGLSKGFVITHINNEPVSNPQEVVALVKQARRSILIEGMYANGAVAYYGIGL